MKRPYGTGQIYEKSGAYYGRWRTADGRRLNRKLGPIRKRGEADGLTRAEAEQAFRRIQAEEAARKPVEPVVEIVTVDQAADRLRERIAIEGARLSYRQNCESMQRVHISPALGRRRVAAVTTEDVERLASRMLARGSSPKTVRNVMTFLHSVFALAVRKGWAPSNPVQDAARPRRRRAGDASPDLQCLTLDGLDRVIDVIPDRTVDRDALGPVVRLIVLAAGTTGLRQSELLGSRWRDVEPGNSSYSASPRSGMHPPTLVPLEYQRSRRRLGRASHASPRAGLAGDEIASLRSSSVPLQLHFGSPLDLVVSGVIAP